MTDEFRQKIKVLLRRPVTYGKRKAVSDSGPTNAVGDAMITSSSRLALTVSGRSKPPSSTQHDDTLESVVPEPLNHTLPTDVPVLKGPSFKATESPATNAGAISNSNLPPNDPVKVLALQSSNHTPPINAQVLNELSLEAAGSPMTHTGGSLNSGGKLSTTTQRDNTSIDMHTSRASCTSPVDSEVLTVPSLEAPGNITETAGIFPNASHFSITKSLFVDKSKTVNYYGLVPQADTNSKAMKQLFELIIPNASHDSSPSRPACCPGTRQKVNECISSWFYDPEKRELLFWIYGHAGVGKSTIVQTFAEDLEDSEHLGASVFISGLKNSNDSKRVIVTIAYQLAQRIEGYRDFVAERLDLDPDLVNKRMKEQFRILIVEPFAEKVRADGAAWGILLDGLDELDEPDQQEIIGLITAFVSEHPKSPFMWVIASRQDFRVPEDAVVIYRKEEIPVNSPASRQDIETFFRSRFRNIRNTIHPVGIVSRNWPGHESIQKLVSASSGLFVFADAVMRFIGDTKVANPIVRLNQVLSMIDGVRVASKPFALLDTFYARILRSVSHEVWPTTKRVFSAILYAQRKNLERELESLRGTSIILSLELSMIYASLNKCISVMELPSPADVDKEPARFYHASFGQYLLDNTRSESFSISGDDADKEVCQSLSKIWQDFQAQYSLELDSECDTEWLKYCKLHLSDDDNERIESLLKCIRNNMLATN